MMKRLIAAFSGNPRIAEAWLLGQRLIPEGLQPWEETDITLVLDPPLPDPPDALQEMRDEMAAIDESLASTGWVRKGERRRGWIYSRRHPRTDRRGMLIYSRDAASR